MILCKDLSLDIFQDQKSFELQIPRNKITVVLGLSGSGKSTFLRYLNRLNEPRAGSVFLDEVDICTIDPHELRRRVGLMSQTPIMFSGTVEENLEAGPKLNKRELTSKTKCKLLEDAAIEESFLQKEAQKLSGGEKQRVSLARLLANEAEVLLLDEPTSALDPMATRKIEETIVNLMKNKTITVVWVTHSLQQALRLADKLVVFDKGNLVTSGDIDQVCAADNFDIIRQLKSLRGI